MVVRRRPRRRRGRGRFPVRSEWKGGGEVVVEVVVVHARRGRRRWERVVTIVRSQRYGRGRHGRRVRARWEVLSSTVHRPTLSCKRSSLSLSPSQAAAGFLRVCPGEAPAIAARDAGEANEGRRDGVGAGSGRGAGLRGRETRGEGETSRRRSLSSETRCEGRQRRRTRVERQGHDEHQRANESDPRRETGSLMTVDGPAGPAGPSAAGWETLRSSLRGSYSAEKVGE